MNSDSVVVQGSMAVITPAQFGLGKSEYIRFPKGTFLDLDNNEHKGILTNTEWNFNVANQIGIDGSDLKEMVKIYPNPSPGKLTVKAFPGIEIKDIRLFNDIGQLILEKNDIPEDCCEFDLSPLSKGLYGIVISIGDRIYSQSLLIR